MTEKTPETPTLNLRLLTLACFKSFQIRLPCHPPILKAAGGRWNRSSPPGPTERVTIFRVDMMNKHSCHPLAPNFGASGLPNDDKPCKNTASLMRLAPITAHDVVSPTNIGDSSFLTCRQRRCRYVQVGPQEEDLYLFEARIWMTQY